MTLNDVYAAIEDFHANHSNALLSSSATHVAIDRDGSIFGYNGHPRVQNDSDEWTPGEGGGDRIVMFCGITIEEQPNWKELVWEIQ